MVPTPLASTSLRLDISARFRHSQASHVSARLRLAPFAPRTSPLFLRLRACRGHASATPRQLSREAAMKFDSPTLRRGLSLGLIALSAGACNLKDKIPGAGAGSDG